MDFLKEGKTMATRKRKPQPHDNLRTRIELEVYAKQHNYAPRWVDNVLDARLRSRKS